MGTIYEDENTNEITRGGASAMSKNLSQAEQDPANRSTNLLDDSVADPTRKAIYINDLTMFLKEEHHKKFGIYTEDFDSLILFWKKHVSKAYRELIQKNKMSKQIKSAVELDVLAGFGLDDLGLMDTDWSPNKPFQSTKPPVYMTPAAKKGASMMKAKPQLPKNNFMTKYQKFEDLLELDVQMTVKQDLDEDQELRLKEVLKAKNEKEQQMKKMRSEKDLSKMKEVIEAYFGYKEQEYLRQQWYRTLNLSSEEIEEREYNFRIRFTKSDTAVNLKSRRNSAAPRSISKQNGVESQKNLSVWISDFLTSQGLKISDKNVAGFLDQEQKHINSSETNCNSMISLMTLVYNQPGEMTNEIGSIINIYNANRMRCKDIVGVEDSVRKMVHDFFKMENILVRLVLIKDKINKSKRKAQVPLYQFYLAMKKEERLVLMINQSHKEHPLSEDDKRLLRQDEEILNKEKEALILREQGPQKLKEYKDKMDMMARKDEGKDKTQMPLDEYMCRFHELRLNERNAKVKQAQQLKEQQENKKKKQEILGQVFGEDFKPLTEEDLKKRELEAKQKSLKKDKLNKSLSPGKEQGKNKSKFRGSMPTAIQDLIDEAKIKHETRSKLNEDATRTIEVKVSGTVLGHIKKGENANDDLAKPKDKWKLGNQLKDLKKQFPHDRVLERMIQEEFKNNQNFMYPEEYDLYDQQEEKSIKKNFLANKDAGNEKSISWKVHDAATDIFVLDQFRKKDLQRKLDEEEDRKKALKNEMKLEMFIQTQAIQYHNYINENRGSKKQPSLPLRTVLARNYQEILEKFPEETKHRFPHHAYGQNEHSQTFKKTFPLGYKRYFFKLVKNIIINAKTGKRVINKNPVTCVMSAASRASTVRDKLLTAKSYNHRLQNFRVAKQIKERWAKYPLEFRSRVFKKKDNQISKQLESIFMTFDEVENCKFEPNCGKQDPNNKKNYDDLDYGRDKNDGKENDINNKTFFEKQQQGDHKIYKMGVLKKAKLNLSNGIVEGSLNMLFEAFNVEKLYANFEPKVYKEWKAKNSQKEVSTSKTNENDKNKNMSRSTSAKRNKKEPEKNQTTFIFEFLDWVHQKVTDMLKDHPKKSTVYAEQFDNNSYKFLYDEAFEFLKKHIHLKEEKFKHQKWKQDNRKTLSKTRSHSNDTNQKDFRKIYKTIMCPLREKCPKVKFQRWPSSNLKTTRNFGHDCPYAHHPMELQFPETLETRYKASKSKKSDGQTAKIDFKYSGPMFDCQGCGGRCNLCEYKKLADKVISQSKHTSEKELTKIFNYPPETDFKESIQTRQHDLQLRDEEFFAKFGLLKKGSVLMFYGLHNEAHTIIAKACKIIQTQHDRSKEQEQNLQKKWQLKLGLPDAIKIPNLEKFTEQDLNDEAQLKKIDRGTCDMSTLQLYLKKVCPLIRDANDKNLFLNQLIEELFYKIEDQIIRKGKTIEEIKKRTDKLNKINKIYEALSDADKDPENILDANGKPMKIRKKKKKMCSSIFQRKKYQSVGIEMKTKDKYFIETVKERQYVQDPKTGRQTCILCPKGKNCPDAHNPIQLDLIKIQTEISNLNEIQKTQTMKQRNDNPMVPWAPTNNDVDVDQFEDRYLKKKKKVQDKKADEEDKNQRKGILQRENIFKKPYEKD